MNSLEMNAVIVLQAFSHDVHPRLPGPEDVNIPPSSELLGSSISGSCVAALVIVVVSACSLCIFALVYAVRHGKGETSQ
nr:lymphocyte antigen 75-like [Biomphalaria glabrata]